MRRRVYSAPVAVGRGDRDGASEDDADTDTERNTVAVVASEGDAASVSELHGEYSVSVARGDADGERVTRRVGLDGA